LHGGDGGDLRDSGYGGRGAVGLHRGVYGVGVLSLSSSPLYIGSRRPPNDPLIVLNDLGEVLEQTGVGSVKKRVHSRGFRRPEPVVRAGGTAGPGHASACQTF
jgi:hypothetical protein